MDTPASPRPSSDLTTVIGWVVCSAVALVAAWTSYDFGAHVGGALLGVVAAINGAAMGALLASAVTARVLPSR